MKGEIEVFEYLLEKGANTGARDALGRGIQEYIKMEFGVGTKMPKTQAIKEKMS